MIIDVSSILKVLGGKVAIDCDLPLSEAEFLGGMYEFNAPVKVVGSVSNNGQSLILRANCSGTMRTQCARCLCDVDVDFDFDVEEQLMQNDESEISTDSDVIVFDGYAFELDDIIYENFLMNINGSYLCSEDCKGLCHTCGKNLNNASCDCDNTDIDPRWSSLLEIMKKDEN